METNEKIIYHKPSKITKDSIVIYGAGKFQESNLKLNKTRAIMLYLELNEFLKEELCDIQ